MPSLCRGRNLAPTSPAPGERYPLREGNWIENNQLVSGKRGERFVLSTGIGRGIVRNVDGAPDMLVAIALGIVGIHKHDIPFFLDQTLYLFSGDARYLRKRNFGLLRTPNYFGPPSWRRACARVETAAGISIKNPKKKLAQSFITHSLLKVTNAGFAPALAGLVNLILTLRPVVDQHAPADAKISYEPHGLHFSAWRPPRGWPWGS